MKKLKVFEPVIIICIGLAVIFYFSRIPILLYIAGLLMIISILSQKAAIIIGKLWLKLGELLGFISSRILLTIIYYLFLFPIALLSGIFRGDFLNIKKKPVDSAYKIRNHQFHADDLKNPW